jgi:hypothetical protein
MLKTSTFTTAAMSAALEETPITYEELADIEREFEDVEIEISKPIDRFVSSTATPSHRPAHSAV